MQATKERPSKPTTKKFHRVKTPLNLNNWARLPEDYQRILTWFHQYALDHDMPQRAMGEAIQYDGATVSRVLQGTYEGNWDKVIQSIKSFQKLAKNRASIQKVEFVKTYEARLIWKGLDYALANNSIVLMQGESGQGKTLTASMWKEANNHGRTSMVEAPVMGGLNNLLTVIMKAIGGNTNASMTEKEASILRAFNPHRMLIIDEAHRLLPTTPKATPVKLEQMRRIHDITGCGLAFITTRRWNDQVKETQYQYEQILGRIGMPIQLPKKSKQDDTIEIVKQFISTPSAKVKDLATRIANGPGRNRLLVEQLKVAVRMAVNEGKRPSESHFVKAVALRQQMGGLK